MSGDPDFQTRDGCRDCGGFFLDIVGLYPPQSVRTRWVDQPRPTNPEVEAVIERTWAARIEQATRDDRQLFDGRLCRLIEYTADNQEMVLTVGPVSFKEFLGTNATNAQLRYLHGPEVLADPIGVSAALSTADGYILLGRRSERVALYPGRVHPIGGMLEPAPGNHDCIDPFEMAVNELREETALDREAITKMTCVGLIRDKNTVQPELIFDLELNVDATTIRQKWAQAPDLQEHSDLVPIRNHPSSLVTYVEHNFPELTPVAMATLLLHGLTHWGSGWFAAARGYLRSVI